MSFFKRKNRASDISIALIDSGLVNRKDVCIKNYGSTFACVCPECIKEYQQRMSELFKPEAVIENV